MDVERTIEFLLANQAAHDQRLASIETSLGQLADKVKHLDDVMVILADSHITLVKNMDKLVQNMDQMAARMRTIAEESNERDRQLGARIDSLVSAFGDYIRNRPSTGD